ncbi:MAG: hypothetical protein ACFFDS_08480 [Candidatus Thorarchaeota archaeon]
MSETTTTTTKTTTAKKPIKTNWEFAGYWDALIGGFILVVQGFLTFFWTLAPGITFLGSSNFFTLATGTWYWWFNAVIQMLLGIFVLILIWAWIQDLLKIGVLVQDKMWLGIILIVIGLITLGLGGVLVLVGGIFYLLSIKK